MASLGEAKEKARKAQNEGQYEKAIKIYMQILAALKNNPDPSFYNTIGDIYLNNMKKNAEAVENYRAALTIYVNQSWHSNAIVMAKKIIKVDPSLLEMYETVADLYKKMGSLGEALNSYILLAEKALQANNKALAIEAFKKTLELMPDKVEIKDKLVELYMQENNFEFAHEYLKDIESYHMKRGDLPQATATRRKISQLESKMGKPAKEEKREEIKEEVKVEPPKPVAEESFDIDINDLTAGLSEQLDKTFDNPPSAPADFAPSAASRESQMQSSADEDIDGLFREDASSFGSFVELGKLQEDIDVGGAVQSYYQGADGYYESNDLQNALSVYKRIFEIKPDEDRAAKRIIEIAGKTQMYSEALLPYVHLAKEAMSKSPTDALSYVNNALSIDPTYQPAVQLKAALDSKMRPQSPFVEQPKVQPPPAQKPQPSISEQIESPFAEEKKKQAPPPAQKPVSQEPPAQSADRFFTSPAPQAQEENPLDEFAKDILGEMSDLDFLKESEHVTAKDIIQGKNEGNKPKFKVEENKPAQQDSSVWSLQELLDELKEGLDQNIEESDVSSHYDLGVSFKEMGLYDMAIEEFQKSVKNKDFEVKSLEMLGICFLEKQEYDLAESSLIKALSNKGGNETTYLGIKYTLGKLYEAKKMFKEALKVYNEIYTVDSKFEDIEKRINAIKSLPKEIEKNPPKPQQPQQAQKKDEKQNDFIDFSSILKDEISSDISIDDFDVDNFTVELTDEEKENLAKKNNKVSYM